jgi:phage gp29-like protein
MLRAVPDKPTTLRHSAQSMLAAVRPLVSDVQATWSVAGVRSALLSHEQGEFSQSAKLVDAMGRDDRLMSVLDTRINGVLGADLDVLPPEELAEDARAQDIAAEGLAEFEGMFPEADLREAMRWQRMMGFALGQLVWQRTPEAWTPRLRVWHPQWVRYDRDLEHWFVQTRETGEQVVEPGDGHWILFGDSERPWMEGSVRRLAISFLMRQWAKRDWARYSERHGMPIVKAKVPAMASDDQTQAFYRDVRALATETTAVLPQNVDGEGNGSDYDLELLEASALSWEGFQALIAHTSDTYAIDILGHNLTSEVRGGSFAASQTGDSVRDDIKQADASSLSKDVREQGLTHWAKLNHGAPELAPVPMWRVEPPEDLHQSATALKTVGEALGAIKAAGYEVADPEAFGERFGIELAKVEEPEPEDGEGGAIGSVAGPGGAGGGSAKLQLAPTDLAAFVRVNEGRGSVGLGPVPDGDLFVTEFRVKQEQAAAIEGEAEGKAKVDDEGDEDDDMSDDEMTEDERRTLHAVATRLDLQPVRLASGDSASDARGFIEGQLYADALADDAVPRGKRALAVDLKAVLDIIDSSTSYADLRVRLREAYADMDADAFSRVMEKALVLGDLAGHHAVLQDV